MENKIVIRLFETPSSKCFDPATAIHRRTYIYMRDDGSLVEPEDDDVFRDLIIQGLDTSSFGSLLKSCVRDPLYLKGEEVCPFCLHAKGSMSWATTLSSFCYRCSITPLEFDEDGITDFLQNCNRLVIAFLTDDFIGFMKDRISGLDDQPGVSIRRLGGTLHAFLDSDIVAAFMNPGRTAFRAQANRAAAKRYLGIEIDFKETEPFHSSKYENFITFARYAKEKLEGHPNPEKLILDENLYNLMKKRYILVNAGNRCIGIKSLFSISLDGRPVTKTEEFCEIISGRFLPLCEPGLVTVFSDRGMHVEKDKVIERYTKDELTQLMSNGRVKVEPTFYPE